MSFKNKADAIREVSRKNLHWSNLQIKQEVKRKHGLIVSSSAIINVIGSHKKRLGMASYSVNLVDQAKRFLNLVGDYDQARNLLALAETARV
ncbi:hypothetical protein FHS27_000005 [Rhodopirellula rubra]|uniref:Uncharacterized protein n=1 Tax=Aporhodopirellula rubra TaxID=980271 RepID=A0A7W5DTG9_9BACT|nr:hypothetical protein [Aporhodopirellula rubra]MBB3204241.1 hypothetical protein [Aporhodopirellula rubra]